MLWDPDPHVLDWQGDDQDSGRTDGGCYGNKDKSEVRGHQPQACHLLSLLRYLINEG